MMARPQPRSRPDSADNRAMPGVSSHDETTPLVARPAGAFSGSLHARLLSILSRLQSSRDRYERGLAGWVEAAHSIEAQGEQVTITAEGRSTAYGLARVERVLAEHGA